MRHAGLEEPDGVQRWTVFQNVPDCLRDDAAHQRTVIDEETSQGGAERGDALDKAVAQGERHASQVQRHEG